MNNKISLSSRIFSASCEGQSNLLRVLLQEGTGETLHTLAFKEAAEAGHLNVINVFLEHDPQYAQSDLALQYCVKRNHMHVFNRLVDISADYARALALPQASGQGLMSVVENLLDSAILFPGILQNALNNAAREGHLDITQRITDHTPFSERSQALAYAASNNHISVVKYLLPLCDPKFNDSQALQYAVEEGNIEIADLLYPFSNPHAALNNLMEDLELQPGDAAVEYLEVRIENERINKVLSSEVAQSTRVINRKI